MSAVNKVAKMQAVAVGGPTAGAEYEAAQRGTMDLRQQALSDAAARSGAINAPQAFLSSQADRISVPLDAAAQGLGQQAAAANAYSGALRSAQDGYLGAVKASEGLIAQRLRRQSEEDYADIYSKLASQKKAEEDDAEKRADAEERRVKEERDATREFARQDASANQELSKDTYDAIADVLKNSDDLDTAIRYIDGFSTDDDGNYVDSDGNPLDIDPAALTAYITKALEPEAFASLLVQDPKTYGKYAK